MSMRSSFVRAWRRAGSSAPSGSTAAANGSPSATERGGRSIAGLAGLALLAAPAFAVGIGDCPNQMATDVPASTSDGGSTDQCFLGLVLFGWEIGLAGPRCPPTRFHYPAHQECQGRPHPMTRCEITGALEVRMDVCTCVYIGNSRFGVGFPGCHCSAAGTVGSIQNAQTLACFPHTN